ncbi:uncharacterized protein LOC128093145 [Culex pipiens pallens]|uniref:uncharacterized protein LOC128093145 n=1 Tax=Culex pipiens pallens TaxID=42434 RepID=UPI0022AACDDA|nr:uncharacterized protein LOC128093145 [Culex pipiens pallens]
MFNVKYVKPKKEPNISWLVRNGNLSLLQNRNQGADGREPCNAEYRKDRESLVDDLVALLASLPAEIPSESSSVEIPSELSAVASPSTSKKKDDDDDENNVGDGSSRSEASESGVEYAADDKYEDAVDDNNGTVLQEENNSQPMLPLGGESAGTVQRPKTADDDGNGIGERGDADDGKDEDAVDDNNRIVLQEENNTQPMLLLGGESAGTVQRPKTADGDGIGERGCSYLEELL